MGAGVGEGAAIRPFFLLHSDVFFLFFSFSAYDLPIVSAILTNSGYAPSALLLE